VASVRTCPRTHGVIRRAPRTVADLHDILSPDDDVRGQLTSKLRHWRDQGVRKDAQIAIVLLVPMRRDDTTEPEVEQPWAFLTTGTLETIGESLGLWQSTPDGLATLIGGSAGDAGATIRLIPLNAYFAHRRADAARHNRRSEAEDRPFVAVGAGALGSQLLESFARSAFGRWIVVDGDVLLPHNVARHRLPNSIVGYPKADAITDFLMADTASDGGVHRAVVADVLAPGARAEALTEAYANAIDMSASIAVARTLARDVPAKARRLSLFLNPTGADLVLLAEGDDRAVRLDALEMQYYRAVARTPELKGTLRDAVARERYGRSCRDVTSLLSHALVAVQGGLGAQAVERALRESGPAIRVWRHDQVSLGVIAVDVPVEPVLEAVEADWRVVVDAGLLRRIAMLRGGRLPNETGGVLLGAVDVARHIVYVVDTVPSPPDSVEWPTLYIRGAAGLAAEIEQISTATAGQLQYIGEWHSHPMGYPPLPSDDDTRVFVWIKEALDADDLPPVMIIVADEGSAVFVGSIAQGQPSGILLQSGIGKKRGTPP
jgi:hypothetical protein